MSARNEADSIPVAVVGLGAVGRRILAEALADDTFTVVGAADPALAGRPLAELHPAIEAPGRVVDDLGALLPELSGGVVLVATHSRVREVDPLLRQAARAGVDVVSTCEELVWPWLSDPDRAAALDDAFLAGGARCVGTGVNPGFVLDRLPVLLAAVTGPVRHVVAERVVDVARRRPALQRKVGAGLTVEAFEQAADRGAIGHVGLGESAALLAEGLGLGVDELEETLDPLVAEEAFDTGEVSGPAGAVAGLRQEARAFEDGREVLRLTLEMYVGAEAPHDGVRLDADPPIEVRVPGGVEGEAATAHAVLSAARVVGAVAPGLATVLDLPSRGAR